MRRWLAPAVLILVLLGAWEVAARVGVLADALNLQSYLVPAPDQIASTLWNDRSLLASNAWVTLREVLGGLAIAVAIGWAFAVVLHASDLLRRAFYPLLVTSQAVPTIALAPILVVWLGFGIGPKVLIVALVCFFPVTVNTLDGLGSVDAELPKLMRTLDANRRQILRRVEIPSALPFTFSGIKIAAAVAAIGAVFGEWSGSSSGLGHLILVSQGTLDTSLVFAAVVVLAAFSIALFAALGFLERRVAWWGKAR